MWAIHGSGYLEKWVEAEKVVSQQLTVDFIEIRDANGRLLFLFDPVRDLIEVKHKGAGVVLVDLRPLRRQFGAVATTQGKRV